MKSDCGDPSLAYNGTVYLDTKGNASSYKVSHAYSTAATVKPKVIVVHANLYKAAGASLDVVKPTLTAGLVVNPTTSEGAAKSATLTASAGGTATGSVNYTFWWNCDQPGTDLNQLKSQCGDPQNSA